MSFYGALLSRLPRWGHDVNVRMYRSHRCYLVSRSCPCKQTPLQSSHLRISKTKRISSSNTLRNTDHEIARSPYPCPIPARADDISLPFIQNLDAARSSFNSLILLFPRAPAFSSNTATVTLTVKLRVLPIPVLVPLAPVLPAVSLSLVQAPIAPMPLGRGSVVPASWRVLVQRQRSENDK